MWYVPNGKLRIVRYPRDPDRHLVSARELKRGGFAPSSQFELCATRRAPPRLDLLDKIRVEVRDRLLVDCVFERVGF